MWSPSLALVTSPYEWKSCRVGWKPQTKQKNIHYIFRMFYHLPIILWKRSAVKSVWHVLQTYKQCIKHSCVSCYVLYLFISVFDGLLLSLNIAISVCFTAIPFVWCCMICLRCICSVPSFDDTTVAAFMHLSTPLEARKNYWLN